MSWLTESKFFFRLGTKRTSWRGKTLLFYVIEELPTPIIGKEDPSPMIIESVPLYLWIFVNIPCCPVIWFEASESEVQSVSITKLSNMSAARAYRSSLF